MRPEGSSKKIDPARNSATDGETATPLSRQENGAELGAGNITGAGNVTSAGNNDSEETNSRDNKVARLKFDDNSLVPLLCGEHDKHLAHMEKALGVSIVPRGNFLSLSGSADAVASARSGLQALYDRLTRGLPVDIQEVEAVLRLGASGGSAKGGVDEDLVIRTRKRHISPRSKNQADYLRALRDGGLVFALGPAGTGKTYLAVAAAVSRLMKGEIDRVVLSRPAVEAGEQLGFLPGDLREKVDPYLRPLYDALHDMMPGNQVAKCMADGAIEVAPLAFMRGRTLSNAFVILDEAQNTTSVQMKMFLTRLGENASMVVTGDLSQVDLPHGIRSGLRDATEILAGEEGISIVHFDDGDVMRHPLVTQIVRAYDMFEKKTEAGREYMKTPSSNRPLSPRGKGKGKKS